MSSDRPLLGSFTSVMVNNTIFGSRQSPPPNWPWPCPSLFYALNVATGLIGGTLYVFEGARGYVGDRE